MQQRVEGHAHDGGHVDRAGVEQPLHLQPVHDRDERGGAPVELLVGDGVALVLVLACDVDVEEDAVVSVDDDAVVLEEVDSDEDF